MTTTRTDHYQLSRSDGTVVINTPIIIDNTVQTSVALLSSKAQDAITNNLTYLAITGPSNAQVIAQVAALTRQINAIIKLLSSNIPLALPTTLLQDTSGT